MKDIMKYSQKCPKCGENIEITVSIDDNKSKLLSTNHRVLGRQDYDKEKHKIRE